jgi:hypothetical protein
MRDRARRAAAETVSAVSAGEPAIGAATA